MISYHYPMKENIIHSRKNIEKTDLLQSYGLPLAAAAAAAAPMAFGHPMGLQVPAPRPMQQGAFHREFISFSGNTSSKFCIHCCNS